MSEHFLGSGSLMRIPGKHRSQELSEGFSLILLEMVLLNQHLLQGPIVQSTDMFEMSLSVEILLGVLARECHVLGHPAKQLHHLSEMVVILVIVASFSRLKQEVSSDHFKDSAGKAPHVSRRVVIDSHNHLWRPVLSRLDLRSKVVISPTTIAHVANLDHHVLIQFRASPLRLLFLLLKEFLLLLSDVIFKEESGEDFTIDVSQVALLF